MLTGGGLENKDRLANFLNYIPPMGSMKSYVWGSITAVAFLSFSIGITNKLVSSTEINGSIKIGPTVEDIGIKLLTDHVLMFELSSVLLLGALIGTHHISRPSKEFFLERK